jgi:hypothetical protein
VTDTSSRRCSRGALLLAVGVALVAFFGEPLLAHARTKRPYVQKKYLQVVTGTSVSVTFRRPNVAGNLIVAYVVWDNADAVTIADNAGNAYTSAVGPTQTPGDGVSAQIFYAPNVRAGVNIVTATFTTPITTRGVLYLYEYQGFDRLSPLDTTVAATGTALTIDSGPITTASANEMLFIAVHSNARSVGRFPRGTKVRQRKYGNAAAELVAVAPGTYDVTAVSRGTAWTIQVVAFRPVGAGPQPPTAYPLKVSPNGRYLVDQNGVPFLMTGDSPQALTVNLSEAEADAFFADRQAAGFNLVWINLLCATYTGGRDDGSTYDGIIPFTGNLPSSTVPDLATPNEAFFARVDDMLHLAAQHGLVVLLDPAETGSYLAVLNANGATKARNYGRYLGTRYKSFDNIIWMHGNDFQSWPNAGDDAVVQAVARGIHDTDDRHIHTVELDYQVSGSLDDASWAPLIDLNASYTYYPTYAQVLTDYDRPNAIPTFLVEANYEFEHNAADLGTPAILRRQAYWALLSGAAGHLYGNRYTWPFIDGWQTNLDTPGSAQIGLVKFAFASRQWFNLVPDQDHSVVTAGYGTYADSGALGDSDYLTAARTPDASLVMAYMPTRRTITVDMSRLGAAVYAQWYDPTTGLYTVVSGSPLANSGMHDFTPPGDNGDGDGDWLLVLEATSVPPDTTPPSVPTGLGATVVSSTEIDLAWSPSTDDVAVAGYRIYRDGVLVHTTPATAFADTGLAGSTTYAYAIAAFDYANNASAQSAPPVSATTAGPGPTFVQQSSATPQSPQTSVAATYPAAQTAGDTNILAIGWNDTAASIVSVVDAAGNAYQPAIATFRGNGMSQAIYYAPSIVAAGAGANQVTVTFSQPAVFVDLRITEYAGLRTTSPFDAGVSATDIGTTATTSTLMTATASELLFAAGMTGATFTAPGAGYTSRVITSPDGDIVEDAEAVAAGGHSANASLTSGTWILQLAAFAPAGS